VSDFRWIVAAVALLLAACGADPPSSSGDPKLPVVEKPSVAKARALDMHDLAIIRTRAESGDKEAQFLLGRSLRMGDVVSDAAAKEGLEWIRKSADQGWVESQTFLGEYYKNGECHKSDLGNAFFQLLGCEPGFVRPDDTIDLAPFDHKEALRWLTIAANRGNSRAQWKLGEMYELGQGVAEDKSEAVTWYRQSADQGDPGGRLALGLAMEEGRGVEKNVSQAIALMELAAQDGYGDAQQVLGSRYKRGDGVTADLTKAIHWYKLAGEQGSIFALWALANMYRDGDGVIRDYKEAMKWFRLAAKWNSAYAENMIGIMYDNGEGVSEDDAEAVKWYRLAADRGNPTAQYNLALRYNSGTGVPENDSEAVKWFRLAAEQGNVNAQESLGEMYAAGEGVSQSHAEAYFWLSLAAASGSKDSIDARDQARAYLKPAKTMEMQARATSWVTATDYAEAKRRAGVSGPHPVGPVESARSITKADQPDASISAAPATVTSKQRETDIAIVITSARLRASPDGQIMASIAPGTELALLAREAINGWYEVIDVESGALGWVHQSVIRLELAASPALPAKIFQAQATGVDAPPAVYVENKSNQTIWLRVSDQKYTIAAGQRLTVDVPAGSHRFNAWAAGVIPASGTEAFQRGFRYNWGFWIERR
jgi:TPR repeat protein